MTIDWSALLLVGLVAIGSAAVVVTLFSNGIKLLAVPPADQAVVVGKPRDDETDDVSDPTRPRSATLGGIVFFVLSAIGVLFGVYLIIPALHG
jgi:hypothetical protein